MVATSHSEQILQSRIPRNLSSVVRAAGPLPARAHAREAPTALSAGQGIPSWAIWCALNLVCSVVVVRWFAGAAPRLTPLQSNLSVGFVSLLDLVAWVFLWLERGHCRSWRIRGFALALSLFPLIVLACCVRSDGLLNLGCIAGMSLMVIGESFAESRGLNCRPRCESNSASTVVIWQREPLKPDLGSNLRADEGRPPAMRSDSPKRRHADGHWMNRDLNRQCRDQLDGETEASFRCGQKHAIVHIAFCPPFAAMPEFTCDMVEPSAVRVKVAAVYPYGARIELKRIEGLEVAGSVRLRYTASDAG